MLADCTATLLRMNHASERDRAFDFAMNESPKSQSTRDPPMSTEYAASAPSQRRCRGESPCAQHTHRIGRWHPGSHSALRGFAPRFAT